MWTADEYHRMAEVGILHEDDRVKLIDGNIVQIEPISSRHAACTSRLNKLLHHWLDNDIIESLGNPVRFDQYTEPQPESRGCAFVPTTTPTPCLRHRMCCSL
jgi:hypothetical protein